MQKIRIVLVSGCTLAAAMDFSGLAHAQSAPSGQTAVVGLEEIVVSARRKVERSQDVPVAVTALSGNALEQQSVVGIKDLPATVPSLRIIQAVNSASSSYYSIRGQTGTDIRLTADLAVGYYVDGVYNPRALGADAAEFIDIQRVEVLKGPQGTLFGRNTTGGAILVTTNPPTDKFEGMVKVKAGNYGMWGVSGVVNIPLAPQLAARFIASYTHRDGFGRDLISGGELGRINSPNLRGALKWDINDSVTAVLRGDFQKFDGSGLAIKPVRINAGTTAVNEIIAETGLSAAAAQAAYLSYAGGNPQDASVNVYPSEHAKIYGASLTFDVKLSESLNLRSISGYRGLRRLSSGDLDGSPYAIFNVAMNTGVKDRQLSQELLLFGDLFDKRFDWTTGGYYGHEKGVENGQAWTAARLAPNNLATTIGDVVNKNGGVFFQGTYHVLPKLSVTGGVRYTKDTRDLTSYNHNVLNCTALGQPLTAGTCRAVIPSLNTDAVNYTASVDYKPADDILLYFRTSKGYRSGGQQISGGNAASPAAAAASFTPFLPEYVTDYELGLKADWFDHRLRTNVAGFTANYSDIQRSTALLVGGQTISFIQNVAKGKINGIEVETTAQPIAGLELGANMAYTDAKYTAGVPAGTPYLYVPKWTYGLSAAYTLPTSFGDVRGQMDFFHQDTMTTSGNVGTLPSFNVVNARLTAKIDQPGIEVSVYSKNLFNKVYYSYSTDVLSVGFVPRVAAPPRTFGAEIVKRF